MKINKKQNPQHAMIPVSSRTAHMLSKLRKQTNEKIEYPLDDIQFNEMILHDSIRTKFNDIESGINENSVTEVKADNIPVKVEVNDQLNRLFEKMSTIMPDDYSMEDFMELIIQMGAAHLEDDILNDCYNIQKEV